MVLKSVIRYVINRYLKNYIERLDDEKLNIDLRNGNVQLENLHLKPEALSDLNLPILVAAGYLEKFSLTIPWMNLSRRPSEIHLQGLYLLIVPKNEMERDEREHQMNKMRKVQKKVEEMKRVILENIQLDEKDQSLFEKISEQILQNIRITVENFHFSYQTESTSKLGHRFSFGLTFQFIQIIGSTEEKSKSKSKSRNNPIIYSLKEIRYLSIYWNRFFQSRHDRQFNDLIKQLKEEIRTKTDPKMNYSEERMKKSIEDNEMKLFHLVLPPSIVDLNLKLFYHRPEEKFHRKSFDFQMDLDQMSLFINSQQFSDLLDFIKFQNYSTLYERCRQYRDLYLKEYLDHQPLTNEEREKIQILERKLDTFNLAYIRFSVETELNEENIPPASSSSMDPSSSSSSSSASKGKTMKNKNVHRWQFWKNPKQRSFDEYHSIAKEISQMYSDDSMKLYFEDLPSLNIRLKSNELHLYLVEPKRSIENEQLNNDFISYVHVQHSDIQIEKRSISSNTRMKFSFPQIELYGYQSNEKELLVYSIEQRTEKNPLMYLEFELFPDDTKKSDYRFLWQIQPIQIIYSFKMFNEIVKNFEVNQRKESEFYSLQIREHSYDQMQIDLHHQKIFDLTIHINQLDLSFPHSSKFNKTNKDHLSFDQILFNYFSLQSSMRFQLKNLSLQTIFQSSSQNSPSNEKEFYQKYQMKFNHLKIVSSSPNGESMEILQGKNQIRLIFDKCLYIDDLHLKDWILSLHIDTNDLIPLSIETISTIQEHFQSIPQISSTIQEIFRRINLYFVIFHPSMSMDLFYSIRRGTFLFDHSSSMISSFNLNGSLVKKREFIHQIDVQLSDLFLSSKSSAFHRINDQDQIHFKYQFDR